VHEVTEADAGAGPHHRDREVGAAEERGEETPPIGRDPLWPRGWQPAGGDCARGVPVCAGRQSARRYRAHETDHGAPAAGRRPASRPTSVSSPAPCTRLAPASPASANARRRRRPATGSATTSRSGTTGRRRRAWCRGGASRGSAGEATRALPDVMLTLVALDEDGALFGAASGRPLTTVSTSGSTCSARTASAPQARFELPGEQMPPSSRHPGPRDPAPPGQEGAAASACAWLQRSREETESAPLGRLAGDAIGRA
jgi:hypothetical protein